MPAQFALANPYQHEIPMNSNTDNHRAHTSIQQENDAQKHFDHILDQLNNRHPSAVPIELRRDAAALVVEATASKGFKAGDDIALLKGNNDNLIAIQGEGPTARTASVSLDDIRPGEFERIARLVPLSSAQTDHGGFEHARVVDRDASGEHRHDAALLASSDGPTFPPTGGRGAPARTAGSGMRLTESGELDLHHSDARGTSSQSPGDSTLLASSDGPTFPPTSGRGAPARTAGSGMRLTESGDLDLHHSDARGTSSQSPGDSTLLASSDGPTFPPTGGRGAPSSSIGSSTRLMESDSQALTTMSMRVVSEQTRSGGERAMDAAERTDTRIAFAQPEMQPDTHAQSGPKR